MYGRFGNIQAFVSGLGVNGSIKHGLAYPREISSARIFGGPRVQHCELEPFTDRVVVTSELRDAWRDEENRTPQLFRLNHAALAFILCRIMQTEQSFGPY
jgi:hypothetical protein